MLVKIAKERDLTDILGLYTYLHGNPFPEIDDRIRGVWEDILGDKNHFVLLGREGETAVSSCVLIIVPNLTHGQRPYALIENVVTHPDFRNRGYASRILNRAKEIAFEKNCYKIMLMTGSKQESTLVFYRKAGYNSNDKTAFIQWL